MQAMSTSYRTSRRLAGAMLFSIRDFSMNGLLLLLAVTFLALAWLGRAFGRRPGFVRR